MARSSRVFPDPDGPSTAKHSPFATVNVNGGIFFGADAPFGGYKQSGVGREMGREGFEEYLETKTMGIGV